MEPIQKNESYAKETGASLNPGGYVIRTKGVDAVEVLDEGGMMVSKITMQKILASTPEIKEYKDIRIRSAAVFNDGKKRFNSEYSDFLHIALSYTLVEWVGGDWNDATKIEKQGLQATVVFNRNLADFVVEDDLFSQTMKNSDKKGTIDYRV